jgi:hypothetical protein
MTKLSLIIALSVMMLCVATSRPVKSSYSDDCSLCVNTVTVARKTQGSPLILKGSKCNESPDCVNITRTVTPVALDRNFANFTAIDICEEFAYCPPPLMDTEL